MLILTKEGLLDLEKVNSANYLVPEKEENHFHCKIENPSYDQRTGKKTSVARIQKFGSKNFPQLLSSMKRQGFVVEILHDPTAPKSVAAEPAPVKAEEPTPAPAPKPTVVKVVPEKVEAEKK